MLERLSEADVTLNIDKCTFRVPKIMFLGNVVSANGIEVDPDKVAAVVNLHTTKNVHKLCVLRNGKPPKQVCKTFSRQHQTNPRPYAEG